jgi:hypothetical protein
MLGELFHQVVDLIAQRFWNASAIFGSELNTDGQDGR